MDYEIRFAEKSDIALIMSFIDEYWKKGHILSKNRSLFEWQYLGINKVNMVLGFKNGALRGVLGFIIYDESCDKDIALALWKAVPGENFLGMKLLMFLIDNEPHRLIMCPGINMSTTAPIYRRMGLETGKMTQWYRLCPRSDYSIAKIINLEIPTVKNVGNRYLVLDSIDKFKERFDIGNYMYDTYYPYKSLNYLERRYYSHPAYNYNVVGLERNTIVKTAVVFRIQEYNGSKAVRVVDVVGDVSEFGLFTEFFDVYLKKVQAEYVDIYEAGMSENDMYDSGWKKVEESGNTVPNYFAPYLDENIDIYYSMSDSRVVLFRGDGDQDRPN